MLSLLVTLVVFLMLGTIVFQTFYVLNYQAFINEGGSPDPFPIGADEDEFYAPPAAIVLCLKGTDESLEDCLGALVDQDYPDYQLNIVIDSPTDPAVEVAQDVFAALKYKPIVEFLTHRETSCSLKCSAIAQAVDSLPERIEVVAFVDGDTVVDQFWLRDLVTPLGDSGTGVTTGNRWYSPDDLQLGSLVRKIWNAAAVVQMQRYEIAWGGSLAIRRAVIDRCGLVATWRKSFCEDTSLTKAMRHQKLRVYRVANLIVENNDGVSLGNTYEWICRQMLTVRLHHPDWRLVLLHGITTGIASIVAPLMILVLFAVGNTGDAVTMLQCACVYQTVNFALLYMIGQANRRSIIARESYSRSAVAKRNNWPMHIAATLVTQVIQPFAVWQAFSMKKVTWRGVDYCLKGGAVKRIGGADTSQLERSGKDATAGGG